MRHISSPVFTDSLSGWAIEKTKTINDGLSTGKGCALTLAVTVVVLPIFAVLDAAMYLVPAVVALLAFKKPALLSKLARTILFIVQVPFLMLANLFGANLLPKVNYGNMYTGIVSNNCTFQIDMKFEKFRFAINQYKHGECSFEELMECNKSFKEHCNQFDNDCGLDNEYGYLHFARLVPFPLNEYLQFSLENPSKALMDKLLGKPNTASLSEKATKDMNQVLEETCVGFVLGEDTPDSRWRNRRNYQAAMAVMEKIDQPFSQGNQDHLIRCLPRVYEQIPNELTKGLLDYVKRSGDIEFGQAIIISLQEEAASLNHPPERFQGILSALSDMIKEQTAKRTAEVREETPLKPPGLVELIASYEVVLEK